MYQIFLLNALAIRERLRSPIFAERRSALDGGQAEAVHYPVRLGEHPDEYAVVYSCKTYNRNTTVHK